MWRKEWGREVRKKRGRRKRQGQRGSGGEEGIGMDGNPMIKWNLYNKDNLGPATFVLNREVSSSHRLQTYRKVVVWGNKTCLSYRVVVFFVLCPYYHRVSFIGGSTVYIHVRTLFRMSRDGM